MKIYSFEEHQYLDVVTRLSIDFVSHTLALQILKVFSSCNVSTKCCCVSLGMLRMYCQGFEVHKISSKLKPGQKRCRKNVIKRYGALQGRPAAQKLSFK